jgi:hypothetical protein
MTDSNEKPLVPNYVPGVGRLVTDRYDFQSHINGSAFNHNATGILLSPLITIDSINYDNVQSAVAALALNLTPPTIAAATQTTLGLIKLTGDVTGISGNSIIVSGLRGVPIANLAPTTGQLLAYSGTNWTPSNNINITGSLMVGSGTTLSGSLTLNGVTTVNNTITVGSIGSIIVDNAGKLSSDTIMPFTVGGPFTVQQSSTISMFAFTAWQGIVDTQTRNVKQYSGTVSTSSATATTILTIPLVTSNTCVVITGSVVARQLPPNASNVGSENFTLLAQNAGGTVTSNAIVNLNTQHMNSTPFITPPLSATISGTNILLQVTAAGSVSTDWQVTVVANIC